MTSGNLNQLQLSVKKKDEEINGYKKKVDMLETTIQQLINRLELREKNIRTSCQIVKSLKDAAYEWVMNFGKLKECKQFSGPFYVVLLPLSFELSAVCVNSRLEIWLHRYRGKTER